MIDSRTVEPQFNQEPREVRQYIASSWYSNAIQLRPKNKQLIQVSGLCSTPFLSNLPKRSTQIYELSLEMSGVPLRDTNMAAGCQRKHLDFTFATKAITFC